MARQRGSLPGSDGGPGMMTFERVAIIMALIGAAGLAWIGVELIREALNPKNSDAEDDYDDRWH